MVLRSYLGVVRRREEETRCKPRVNALTWLDVLHGNMARAEWPKKDEFQTPNSPMRTGRFCLKGVSKKWVSIAWAPARNCSTRGKPYWRIRSSEGIRNTTAEYTHARTVCYTVLYINTLRLYKTVYSIGWRTWRASGTTPTAEHTEYLPPTQSQNPNTLFALIPKSTAFGTAELVWQKLMS